ncbi:MAG: enoyl-CoA hydratase/isomerase family protein [Acidobacteria bacterium ACB1]|nr:putative enoyl-CoA hydratase [Pyrinomonadaceae bacterium]MCE7962556.1 enoyl-CoA hydratase/isomerase family protein [Acidobacteria bacterium ACB1]RIJ95050.1 MAG: crotonase [Acidobacteriota bacterium]
MTKEALKIARIDTAMVVTFTRPEIRNPLSVAVVEQLNNILDDAESDVSIDKIILTGSDNVFASGADLREISALLPTDAPAFARRGQVLMGKIASSRHKTIAAITGFCFGGALDLALACDTRIASPNSQFAHPGANLGIITGWGGTQRLPRLVGRGNALEMFFTAAPISAEKALKIGLIDEIADDPLGTALLS